MNGTHLLAYNSNAVRSISLESAALLHNKRVWFKKLMAQRLCACSKWSTSRNHALKQGKAYVAVCGSRFKAQPFGFFRVISAVPLPWKHIIEAAYEEEGFRTRAEMRAYLIKEKLMKPSEENKIVWFHEIDFRRLT